MLTHANQVGFIFMDTDGDLYVEPHFGGILDFCL